MNEHSSYEISKRLHDKGFRAEHGNGWMLSCLNNEPFCGDNENSIAHARICPAYTFTELWGAMPGTIPHKWLDKLSALHMVKGFGDSDNQSFITYTEMAGFDHESPAECAAMMVEWLLDNGHIESEVE